MKNDFIIEKIDTFHMHLLKKKFPGIYNTCQEDPGVQYIYENWKHYSLIFFQSTAKIFKKHCIISEYVMYLRQEQPEFFNPNSLMHRDLANK